MIFNISSDNKNLYNNNYSSNVAKSNSSTTDNKSEDKNDKKNDLVETDNKETVKNITQEVVLSTYTTSIYDQDQNRVDNITLANSKLNGYIVKNGEEFSFNNTIGPMNEAQGFKKAVGFDSQGNKIQISGGGLCQISSTLYNAVLDASLEVTERHAHSRRVYYVPQDRDATILYGSLDFKFKNNSGSDIKIESTNDNTNVTITLKKLQTIME